MMWIIRHKDSGILQIRYVGIDAAQLQREFMKMNKRLDWHDYEIVRLTKLTRRLGLAELLAIGFQLSPYQMKFFAKELSERAGGE